MCPADFGLADYANCLVALIEALALGPAHVAGLSWGGSVVQELYRHDPRLVATLILIKPPSHRGVRLAATVLGFVLAGDADVLHRRITGVCGPKVDPKREARP
jgi:pimeloyl-ACP methyl ester carboxylesterase